MIPRKYVRCAAAQESPGALTHQGAAGNRHGEKALAAIPAELSNQLADPFIGLVEEEDAGARRVICRERVRVDANARERLNNRGPARGATLAHEAVPHGGHDSPSEV